jgi:hypothetical protein
VRRRTVVLGILASLLLAAPADAAFSPPELFVRLFAHEPAGDWIPLAGAPVLNYIGGYQIGFRLQESGINPNGRFQTVSLTITGVPDGQPTQPNNSTPFCVGRNGINPNEIVPVSEQAIQFEGDGTYSLSVSVGPGPVGTGCRGGPTTTASFGVDVHVSPQLVGQPFAFQANPPRGNPFVGIRADDPPGGFADSTCALDAKVNPDGSLSGRLQPDASREPPRRVVIEFPEPGAWTCVTRGVAEGVDDKLDNVFFGTPWSAPLRVDVLSDFRRKGSAIDLPASRRPTFEITAEFPAVSAGGRVTLKLRRLLRCKRTGYLFQKVADYKGVFNANGQVRLRFKRPRKNGFYAGIVSFGGTHFVRPGTDPALILLGATGRSIRFVNPRDYPRC